MPTTLPLTALSRLKRRLVDLLDWLDSITLLEENVLSGPTAAGLPKISSTNEGATGQGGGPTLFAVARWGLFIVACVPISQCFASIIFRFTSPELMYDQSIEWGLQVFANGLAGLVLLRSQLLYALLFGIIGAQWSHGPIHAVGVEWVFHAFSVSALILAAMTLPLMVEWPSLVRGVRSWVYRAIVLTAVVLGVLTQQGVSQVLNLNFYFILAIVVLHTERFFHLGWKRTLRSLAFVVAVSPYVILVVHGAAYDPEFRLWTRAAFYFLLAAPSGCLLYEWAYRRRRKQLNLRGGSA